MFYTISRTGPKVAIAGLGCLPQFMHHSRGGVSPDCTTGEMIGHPQQPHVPVTL